MGKYILTEYMNTKIGKQRFVLEKSGQELLIRDQFENNKILQVDHPSEDVDNIANAYSVKLYSFADPLKSICTDILGLDLAQCYGTDDDKNSKTHVLWDDIPYEFRTKYGKLSKKTKQPTVRKGPMSGREIMQILGTEVFRKMDTACWARALYNKIEKDGHELAVIVDARFPNEVTFGTEKGGKAVRLLRNPFPEENHDSETALDADKFPQAEFSLIIDNQNKTLKETHDIFGKSLHQWFKEYKLI